MTFLRTPSGKARPRQYGSTGLLSFQAGDTQLERFLPKNQHTQIKHWIVKICVVASCLKLGIFLKIKWFRNWCYEKILKTKNVLQNWYFSMKKKWERLRWFLTLKISALFDNSPLNQFSKSDLGTSYKTQCKMLQFFQTNFRIFYWV